MRKIISAYSAKNSQTSCEELPLVAREEMQYPRVGRVLRTERYALQYPIGAKAGIFDVRARPHAINSVTGTNDLQMVSLTLRVLSKPGKDKLPTIYSGLGLD